MKRFDEQEQFGVGAVEMVTGVKAQTLRQWETRDIYTCELRRQAVLEPHLIKAPDAPGRVEKAREIAAAYESGWRSYTLGDMVRISIIAALMRAGASGKDAGQAGMAVWLPESEPDSQPSGRELMRLLSTPTKDDPDQYLMFFPEVLHLGNPFVHRDWDRLRKHCAAMNRIAPGRAGFILNLSAIRRQILAALDTIG